MVLTPILRLVGFDAATAKSCGLTPHLQRRCTFTARNWTERRVVCGWVCVHAFVCVLCVCPHGHVGSCRNASVYLKPRQSCHCVLESSLKAHYTASLCELLVFSSFRKSAITAEKSCPGCVTLWPHFKTGTPHTAGKTNTH